LLEEDSIPVLELPWNRETCREALGGSRPLRAPWSHPAKAVEISNFPSRAGLARFSDGKRLILTSIAIASD